MKTPSLGVFMRKFQCDSLVRPRLAVGVGGSDFVAAWEKVAVAGIQDFMKKIGLPLTCRLSECQRGISRALGLLKHGTDGKKCCSPSIQEGYSTMTVHTRVAVVHQRGGSFTFEDVEIDNPRSDEVLVRIVACGICHTYILKNDTLCLLVPCRATR
jgi:hypothetical protein